VLVVLSIAVGIFAVAIMMGGRAILMRALETSFPATRPPSVTFVAQPFDEHLVRAVSEEPGVAAAEGRRVTQLSFRVNGGPWQSLTLYALRDFSATSIGKLTLLAGAEAPKRGEMLLERGSTEYSGLKVGDTIEFETSKDKHPVIRVSGIAHDLNAVVPMMTGRSVGYVNFDTLQDLGEPDSLNQLDVVSARPLASVDAATEFGARLRDDVIEPTGVQVLRMTAHKPGVQNLADIFKAVTMLLVIVGVLTLLLSGFLVVNTIGALVAQQTRQIGVMKAVGARRWQLAGMYFAMVLAYGALGLMVALPLGQLATNGFVNFGSKRMNFLVSDYGMPRSILAIELAVGLLVPLAAATVPVVLGMRMPVQKALYNTGTNASEFGDGLIDRILGRIRGLPRPVALALRNTFRRKGRLILTLSALSLAAAVFMSVASVNSSIALTVERVGAHRNMDFWANLYPPIPMAEATRAAERVPGVVAAEGWLYRSAVRLRPDRTESPVVVVTGLPAETDYLRPELTDGRWLKAGDRDVTVVDSGFVKQDPDIKVGSVVTLKMRGVEQPFRVVGIVRGDLLQPYAYVDRTYLDEVVSARGAIDSLMVRTQQHDAAAQSQNARALTDYFSARQMPVTETMTVTHMQSMISDSLGIIVVFLVILAGLLVAVGGIGLSGTMSINVLESTREIGVMRAVGASNGSIYQIFITEGVVVGVASWALGVLMSFPLSVLLTRALESAMGFPLSFAFSVQGIAAWLVFVIVISVLASLLPASRAARVSVAEAIAYE
jgi:putative ABC transport system permease protein